MSAARDNNDHRPIIAISMGDPAGIGPEIIAAALARDQVHQLCRPIVVGDAGVMRNATGYARVNLKIRPIAKVSEATFAPDGIDVYDLRNVDLARMELGKVSAMAGNAAFEAVRTMIELAQSRAVAATVTAPIHKEALAAAGHEFPGHTEIFAHFTGTSDFTMMLAAGTLRVVHVSTHVSLRQACDAVTRQRVLKVIELAHDACRRLGIDKPKIGVAGLNPHASDGGLFGSEEREQIIPACEAARGKGIDVDGPQPPDTFFAKAVGGAYDICVAMYHDQGHIPVKCQGFKYDAKQRTWTSVNGINVSLGLPIIRTSVDHGTAFDQAGKGTASDASLLDAIEYAARLASSRQSSRKHGGATAMRRILVIADDLSGAAEITGIGARHGLSARLDRDAPVVAHEGLTVLDTDTRLLPQDEAAERVRRAVRHLRPGDFELIYKKTDSALRGPLLAELDALMEVFSRPAAVLVAQNPSRGRTIREGVYRIDDVPLSETRFAQDPEYPARTSSAMELLGRMKHRPTQLGTTPTDMASAGVTIGEASDAGDVRRWAEATSGSVLPAGGADFFEAILESRGLASNRPYLTALPPGRMLVVCGTSPAFSGNTVAHAQAEGVSVCPMPDHSHGSVASLEAWHAAARHALDNTGRAVIVIQRPLDHTPGVAQRFQAALAEVVGRLLATPGQGADNLLLEGGATASAVCRRMNWHQFDVDGEFAPGVVQMHARNADGSAGHRLVIKPGSYPWPDTVWTGQA